jgi:hypothetical protein
MEYAACCFPSIKRKRLPGLNRDNPHVLGDHGFTVDDSPRSAAASAKAKDAKS